MHLMSGLQSQIYSINATHIQQRSKKKKKSSKETLIDSAIAFVLDRELIWNSSSALTQSKMKNYLHKGMFFNGCCDCILGTDKNSWQRAAGREGYSGKTPSSTARSGSRAQFSQGTRKLAVEEASHSLSTSTLQAPESTTPRYSVQFSH